MSDRITFIMILHNHQPVGNLDWVIRSGAEDSYLPFLGVLERHEHIRLGLHVTGPLLEWFAGSMPEYLDRIGALVERGRIELLGGAFYEPVLSILPDRDKRGQIEMMNDWLESRFGRKPDGFWVAERVWEPNFASVFGSRGLSYTALDNTHFLYAGVQERDIWGSYVTEDQGVSVRVLPIDYTLRYLIPFHDPQETIDYIGTLKERGVTAVTYADDGEKFGVWPGTKKWVYEEGWLDRFFAALGENTHWIDIVLPGDYVRNEPPQDRVYLPTASYKEMSEWALPVDAQTAIMDAGKSLEGDPRFEALAPFIRGGFWRNFLTKYPESHNMYRRMLMVSGEVEAAKGKPGYDEALAELYRAQCNCGYWHGVFGGLYLNFLRRAIYEHLIRAERLVVEAGRSASSVDFDDDGYDEVILRNDSLNLIVAPRMGGAALELDYIPAAFNLFDTMTRRREAYHRLIPDSTGDGEDGHASIHEGVRSKEDGIRRHLFYDPYRRLNFIDHFLYEDEEPGAFASGDYDEAGGFAQEPYTVVKVKEEPAPGVYLRREGYVSAVDRRIPAVIHKRISTAENGGRLEVSYRIESDGVPPGVLFAVEMNLGLQSGYADDCTVSIPGRELRDARLASTGTETDVREVELTIGWMPFAVRISFSRPAELRRFPIETVSQSEGGVERTYQNTCLLPVWRPAFDEKGRFSVSITMEVES